MSPIGPFFKEGGGLAPVMEMQSFTSQGVVEDTRRGLSDDPKWLSSLYFYDEAGSHLFEEICRTPEYYPTRTEAAILEANATAILEAAGEELTLAELGSGSSIKTKVVLDALIRRQGHAVYIPVDISDEFLKAVAVRLEAEHPGLEVHPVGDEYGHGLQRIGAHPATRRLVLFLGSSIGNFEPPEQQDLLRVACQSLHPGDAFLLGTDLVKDPEDLAAAYNDAAGVTAAFNKNILANLDRLLGGDNDHDAFRHVAFWDPDRSRIEMHLEARRDTVLHYPEGDIEAPVKKGERIHTENSYKFTMERVRGLAEAAGFVLERTWSDEKDWFALHLLRVP